MHDLGFKLLSSDGEDLLALSGSVPHSALGSQPVALVVCAPNVTAGVPTPLKGQKYQIARNLQATPFEVGHQVVVSPNELRRSHVYQKGCGNREDQRECHPSASAWHQNIH